MAIDDAGLDLLFREARTHNKFTDEPISDETLHQLYDILKFGPTSANMCPMRIVFVKSKEAKAKLKPTLDAGNVVIALGPWAPDLLRPLGIKLPLAVKRGYHRHYRTKGNAGLSRPILDADNGYCLAPMEQGIRLTTGAEFAPRDAPPTPVQFDRVLPRARELFALGESVEPAPWLGARPCFADDNSAHPS